MKKNKDNIEFGCFSISLPNEISAVFTIFEDLADCFQTEFQSEAVSILKKELKDISLKPKPNIDYESDYTHIDSRSADTIFEVAKVICNLTFREKCKMPSEIELENIYNILKNWKRPPSQKWRVGDILSIPLLDNTFAFGQIVGTHLTKRCPILALFNLKKEIELISQDELRNVFPLAVYNSNQDEIANYTFKILYNYEILVSPDRVKNKNSSGGVSLKALGNVYFGLAPWNVMYLENYFDSYLLPEIERPKNIIWLNEEERNQYRRKYFKIDENNNRIK
ncbi:Imm26 family immunity protein [Flavobacterium johnsoniae]|jgi:hypothetical protein|uniref:Immunity protein 26 of polymorphic toxin system n=1 Tax=Flavobacterium johnsoniae (strain ATCC 17061 / DSM 2064 / JCM 8514 / BCRC 14874 / CCUG 350202 / NBRC 14942 / NCIMB 11054 / UW101) TaxID=376686 RepID=A5FKB0_FLAJ1|nr:Imm26 family immunity protein [Flavobacterium johnsoniae]ABQ04353.1 hypothetical protein Fjoh_1321 [Flavobacterium johnsoniae UW101]OXE97681.1 hypothetical protein B0A63_16215 [Flavobacterium johnsoniae UW101]WQG83853.1 Imm26 family immunity protein [Flavobacterium johnsoniae UW101]SHK19970.1 Immunity protein 26 [Flavobacterium johnsoniae]